jgi:hypothetical protein
MLDKNTRRLRKFENTSTKRRSRIPIKRRFVRGFPRTKNGKTGHPYRLIVAVLFSKALPSHRLVGS